MLCQKKLFFFVKREIPLLFFVNCERADLFFVKRDLYPPFTTLIIHFIHFIMQNGNTGSRIFVFVSASLNRPDFLFYIVMVVGPNFITVFISIRYYIYQDQF